MYRKTGKYNTILLQEMVNKCEKILEIDIECENIKKSIRLTKKISRNMYLFDIQFKIWKTKRQPVYFGVKITDLPKKKNKKSFLNSTF